MKNKKLQFITIPTFAILLSLAACAIIIFLTGKNPLKAYLNLLQGSGFFPKESYAKYNNVLSDFMSYLNFLTPMIFASLAVLIALKSGLFNIGVSGQMLASGAIATFFIGYSNLGAVLAKPLVIIIGMIVGGSVGYLIGYLKYRFNINEVVSSIMLNYIILYIVSFFINTYFVDPISRQSKGINAASRLTFTEVMIGNTRMDLSIGIVLAILASILVWFFFAKTRKGFEIKAVGLSPTAAKYAGINVGKTMKFSMFLSGVLSGLAGVTFYLGYYASIQPSVLGSTGFDAIAVSLLGNNHPIGVIFSSMLITIISKGSTYMSSKSAVPVELTSVITGMILLFSACSSYIKLRINGKEGKK